MASSSSNTITGKDNAAKTTVWWDMVECEAPKGFAVNVLIHNIKTALMKINYSGPVSFTVYADNTRVPLLFRRAFERTGISLCHVPADLKEDRDKKMLHDMMSWAVDNPAPANFLIISGDIKDFSDELKQLDERGYNILLAHPRDASNALFPGAKSVWHWTSLFTGGFPIDSGEFYPKRLQGPDASRMNQTPNPEKAAAAAQLKWAPHEFFEVKPKTPRIPIPILVSRAPDSDMLADIKSFNDRLKRQRRVKTDETEKLFNYKNRYEEECEYKSTGVCFALHYLREEMMLPTKENIEGVIRYGDRGDSNFDVDEALNSELEHDMIVTQKLGDLSLYLPPNWDLWECVNPEGGSEDQYAKTTWDSIQKFLSSLDGRIEMMISECRYDACLKLKNSCLRKIPLGRVQQIMNLIIGKGWIEPCPGRWKPVYITVARRD